MKQHQIKQSHTKTKISIKTKKNHTKIQFIAPRYKWHQDKQNHTKTKISTKMKKNHTKIHVTTIKWWRLLSRDTQGNKISPKKVTPTHKNYTETDNLLQDARDHHEVMMSFAQAVLTLWQHGVVCTHTIKLPVLERWSLTYHWQTSRVCR